MTRDPPHELAPTTFPPDQHPAQSYLARLSAGSRRAQRSALDRLAALASAGRCDAASLPWHELRYRHTSALRNRLAAELAPTTANRYLSALRGVLRECWRLELLPVEVAQRTMDVRPVPGQRVPPGRALEPAEIERLLAACDGARPIDVRDRAVLAVLLCCGLRRRELVQLDLAHLDPERKQLVIRAGKGRRDGTVPLVDGVTGDIAQWLTVRGPQAGPLFPALSRTGRVLGRRLRPQAVRQILERRADAAGIEPVSPHDLRRTFISRLLDTGTDLATAQRLARHASVQTTSRYDRRGEHARRAAVERMGW